MLKICIVSRATYESGLGHFYRATTLAAAAHAAGHSVTFVCDRLPDSVPYQTRLLPDPLPLYITNSPDRFDWVIVDTPSELPLPVQVDPATKLCLIDGVGHKNGNRVDLVISQGLEGKYRAPKYLILRPQLFDTPRLDTYHRGWLVWGGAADKMGLINAFTLACPEFPAYLTVSDFIQDKPIGASYHHWITPVKDGDLFFWVKQSRKFCVAMGVVVWELLALDQGPIYVFSYTDRHLRSALQMEERGWLRAWPQTGLPPADKLLEFLQEPFTPEPVAGLDGGGAGRIIKLLEEKL